MPDTRRALVKLLKTEGPMDSAQLAARLDLTPMAIRQHLWQLQREKLVTADERPVSVGRPAKYWQLTREADRLFPDAYAELSVNLIDSMREALGSTGLTQVLNVRARHQQEDYLRQIPPGAALKDKVQILARIRAQEGYMAEVRSQGKGAYLLVENHCPICAAATACQGFCDTELSLFRKVLGDNVKVERTEHIVSGSRRCAYRISPVNPS